jgi:shikimate kinase
LTRQIVIIGFMGTGKSTVARALASILNGVMLDLDELITNNEGRTPAVIIEAEGENHFRGIETQTLDQVLNEGTARIIALGGGAWTITQNRELIIDHQAFTVWLDAPFELCWRRIESGREARPLARSRERAERLYHDRRGVYALANSRITIDDDDSAEEIAVRVAHEFRRQGGNREEQTERKAL